MAHRNQRPPSELYLPSSYGNYHSGGYEEIGGPSEQGHPIAPQVPPKDGREEDGAEGESADGKGKEVSFGQRFEGIDHSLTPYQSDGDLFRTRDRIWESFANKTLPPEETELMIKRLERKADVRTRRTYVEGLARSEVVENAPVIRVGFVFMAGTDKPTVTRSEQNALQSAGPDQKNAIWRINTAGALLKQLDVNADLSVREMDQTAIISARARDRMYKKDGRTPNLGNLVVRNFRENAVTVDSQHVEIVEDLRNGNWDLEATLIEVDGISLLALITNCRYLISRGGHMNFDETRCLLDRMIEDARRLCIRSPVLFRMSTRTKISNSKNTRYGFDQPLMFRSISTSKGIEEIIRLSASYFDALDPEGSSDMNQQFIRSRFLQMLTLLLSFLNDDDLEDISGILESTYKIKAERKHIEMLFLKVIPLASINSKIFLDALIAAVRGLSLQSAAQYSSESDLWDSFILQILDMGYILPGSVEDLGRSPNSWIVNWPEDGFKSTEIFRHLQYAGCRLRTINEIPPVDLHPEMSAKEVTVRMVDNKQYIIDSKDLERITKMNTGSYTLIEPHEGRRRYTLEIREFDITIELNQAITRVNLIIDELNKWLAGPRQRLTKFFPTRKYQDMAMLNNFSGPGRMTRHVALLDRDILTVAYKVEGRKIARKDLWRNMDSTHKTVYALLEDLKARGRYLDPQAGETRRALMQQVDTAGRLLAQAADQGLKIGAEEDRSDEPIEQVLFKDGNGIGGRPIWHDYIARYQDYEGLVLEAKVSEVKDRTWRADGLVELRLADQDGIYLAHPVSQGIINTDDEIQIGDIVAQIGQYFILAERDGPARCIATNFLRITGVPEINRARRGRLRAAATEKKEELLLV